LQVSAMDLERLFSECPRKYLSCAAWLCTVESSIF